MTAPKNPFESYISVAHVPMTRVPNVILKETFPLAGRSLATTNEERLTAVKKQVYEGVEEAETYQIYDSLKKIRPAIYEMAEAEGRPQTNSEPTEATMYEAFRIGLGISVNLAHVALKRALDDDSETIEGDKKRISIDEILKQQAESEGIIDDPVLPPWKDEFKKSRTKSLIEANRSLVNYDAISQFGLYALGTKNEIEKAILRNTVTAIMSLTHRALATELGLKDLAAELTKDEE